MVRYLVQLRWGRDDQIPEEKNTSDDDVFVATRQYNLDPSKLHLGLEAYRVSGYGACAHAQVHGIGSNVGRIMRTCRACNCVVYSREVHTADERADAIGEADTMWSRLTKR